MIRILVADDHAIVRKGLVQILQEEFSDAVVTEVSNGLEVLEKTAEESWDVILLDISMPGKNGIEILRQIKGKGIKTPVLMLSMHPEEQYALRVLKAGAWGFLNKEAANEELMMAVHRVLAGRKYITPSLAEKLAEVVDENPDRPNYELLSDREMEVLQLIAKGNTVSEIANTLSLSVNTISTYRTRILEKLRLNNNAELTRYAIDHKLA